MERPWDMDNTITALFSFIFFCHSLFVRQGQVMDDETKWPWLLKCSYSIYGKPSSLDSKQFTLLFLLRTLFQLFLFSLFFSFSFSSSSLLIALDSMEFIGNQRGNIVLLHYIEMNVFDGEVQITWPLTHFCKLVGSNDKSLELFCRSNWLAIQWRSPAIWQIFHIPFHKLRTRVTKCKQNSIALYWDECSWKTWRHHTWVWKLLPISGVKRQITRAILSFKLTCHLMEITCYLKDFSYLIP